MARGATKEAFRAAHAAVQTAFPDNVVTAVYAGESYAVTKFKVDAETENRLMGVLDDYQFSIATVSDALAAAVQANTQITIAGTVYQIMATPHQDGAGAVFRIDIGNLHA